MIQVETHERQVVTGILSCGYGGQDSCSIPSVSRRIKEDGNTAQSGA